MTYALDDITTNSRATKARNSVAAIVAIASLIGPASVASAGVLDSLAEITSGSTANSTSFTDWNTTRNVFRTELNYVLGSTEAHKSGIRGAGVDVALVDTGVAPVRFLDSEGAVLNGPDLSLDYQAGLPAGVDAFGHGTHLAGIIAGRDAGIAPAARLLNMKVGAADGAVDVSQVIAAIDWTVAHRKDPGMDVRVLNLAFGTDSTQSYQSSPLTHAVESAWRAGIVVVVSAGNSGGALVNPATDPFVITVGAVDTNNPYDAADDELAPYSAVGSKSRGVDVLAPGTSITSMRTPGSTIDQENPDATVLLGQYFKGSGTSQAAAVVSGAVALMLDKNPALTPDQVKALLRSTATPLPGVPTTAQGGGVVNIGKALNTNAPSASAAAQKWTRSTGTGSIESARGTSHLVADDGSTLSGEVDVQGAPWTGKTWAPLSTKGAAWSGGTWNGSVWAGGDWNSSTTVDGVEWNARSWRSDTWSARSWRADLWAARSWRSETWEARSWRSGSWE